jgi:hypothetical protein
MTVTLATSVVKYLNYITVSSSDDSQPLKQLPFLTGWTSEAGRSASLGL